MLESVQFGTMRTDGKEERILGKTPKDSPTYVWWKVLRREVPCSLPDINVAGPKGQINSDGNGTQKEAEEGLAGGHF